MESLSENEREEILECIHEMLEEYIESNATLLSKKNYMELFAGHVLNYVEVLAKHEEWYQDEDTFLDEWIENACVKCFQNLAIPLRESSTYYTYDMKENEIEHELTRISEYPNYAQRSSEWYIQRHNLFSASNLWKLFSTSSQFNSLIYEKCKDTDIRKFGNDILAPTSLNWGIKYEQVSVLLYEYKNKTKVNTNYGCIPHETLPIGASPDGIVCDKNSSKYGNMVEIKNIYNRDIDGIPSEEYWIQIQTQLEVARLYKCDFVETRIKEYENKEEYIQDDTVEYKGIILFFLPRDSHEQENCFKYMPIEFSGKRDEEEKWIQETEKEMENTHLLYQTTYWYLDEYSCVEVLRNEHWFQSAIPYIKHGWETVETERVNGFDHRAPQKRLPQKTVTPENNSQQVHVIKLN